MNKIMIYDIEVFAHDWVVVACEPDSVDYVVIHNDNFALKRFIETPGLLLGGFNNKHYDDWVVLTMLNGGSTTEVKKCNDFIIGGGTGWLFPFTKGKRKPFKSFDLRDDIPDQGLSLKAIEGNLGLPIVESSVPFDIDRPLTADELDEVIYYCKTDVDATVALYHARKDYLASKRLVGEMYGLTEAEALGLTNAKLSAKVLGAKRVERDDERDYVMPENIDTSKVPSAVMNFFNTIHDDSIPDDNLFKTSLDVTINGCPVTFAWGGVHGAKPNYMVEATDERLIVNYDVSSLYPNSMINFGFCSRSMADPDAYRDIVATRLKYKHEGKKAEANALKLVINTTYGAMLSRFNDLSDPRSGRSVCITNQLAMAMLVTDLARRCESFDIINLNTDGIMFHISAAEDAAAAEVVEAWCRETGFEMERDDFASIYQKDVNNYIGVMADGKVKHKGGYVSLADGGNFKTNSLAIIHKAIVAYFIDGTPVRQTIEAADDILDFQMIAKTGGSYDGTIHIVDGREIAAQKVNRIYAVADKRYGELFKVKRLPPSTPPDPDKFRTLKSGKKCKAYFDALAKYESMKDGGRRLDKMTNCPAHAFVDNENVLAITDLDLDWYVGLAERRVKDYLEGKGKTFKPKEEITIMKTETTEAKSLNIYRKLNAARLRFLQSGAKKSGKNAYAKFTYFELDDIVPVAEPIFSDLGLAMLVDLPNEESAHAVIIDADNPEGPQLDFWLPLDREADGVNGNMAGMQLIGSRVTYARRYLYMLALDIVEADALDATLGQPAAPAKAVKLETPKKSKRPVSQEQREAVKAELTDADGKASELQVKSIKAAMRKLRDRGEDEDMDFVNKAMLKVKKGLTKKEAEALLIDAGDMLA